MKKNTTCLNIAGFYVLSTTTNHLCKKIKEELTLKNKFILLFANANFIVQCRNFLPWINSDSVILVNDGIGMDIAAKMLYGKKFKENLNGTDFCPAFLAALDKPHKLFLVGAQPGIAEKAGEIIHQRYGHEVVGCADGFEQIKVNNICEKINQSGAEIILVALGNPRQEAWIKDNYEALDAKLIIGVGALFDFISGNIKRAPKWVCDIRCEWLYRLWLEPKRLAKRYSIDILRFFILVFKHR